MSDTALYQKLSAGEPVNMRSPEYREAIQDMSQSWALNASINRAEYAFLDGSLHPLFTALFGNDSNLLIVFYVQIMPDDFVMQLHRF
ncbi:hypothetical protein WP3W18E02_21100 [Klebsiella sp. WP3-W18-ESBL-02]|nr:hypothetical protein WP3W18E02_21100 [Klebsiella sp. WP3-W18-ESBL-02]